MLFLCFFISCRIISIYRPRAHVVPYVYNFLEDDHMLCIICSMLKVFLEQNGVRTIIFLSSFQFSRQVAQPL